MIITILDGSEERTLEFDGSRELRIGRTSDCEIEIHTKHVSRHHASIVPEGGKLFLIDHGSKNGTFLNGRKVSRGELNPADIIVIDGVQIHLGPAAPGAAPSADLMVRDDRGAGGSGEPQLEEEAGASDPASLPTPPAGTARAGVLPEGWVAGDAVPGERMAESDPPEGRSADRHRDDADGAEADPAQGGAPSRKAPPPPPPGAGASDGRGAAGGRAPVPAPAPSQDRDRAAAPAQKVRLRKASRTPVRKQISALLILTAFLCIPGIWWGFFRGLDSPTRPGDGGPAAPSASQAKDLAAAQNPAATPGSRLKPPAGWEIDPTTWGLPGADKPAEPEAGSAARSAPVPPVPNGGASSALGGTGAATAAPADGAWIEAAGAAVQKLVENGQFAAALQASRFLASIVPGTELAESWKERADAIEKAAQSRLVDTERKLGDGASADEVPAAVRSLLEMRPQFAGTASFESLLSRFVEEGLAQARKAAPEAASPPQAARLKDQAAVAFTECRFQDLLASSMALLGLGLPPAERQEALETAFRAVFMDRMLAAFLARVAEKPIDRSPFEEYPGKIVAADAQQLSYELAIDGREGAVQDAAPWRRVTPLVKFSLFEYAGHQTETLLGLVFFARQIGYEDGIHRTIIRLRSRKENIPIADAVLAWHLGIPVPEGGFVEFKGKLMAPAARAAEIARLDEMKRKEEETRTELRKLRRESALASHVEIAKRYRLKGFFKLAQAILGDLAKRFRDTPAGAEAARLVADPVLKVRNLAQRGPAANRVDIYLLGEGYPIEDDYQEAFSNMTEAAQKILLRDEPYKEYQSYFNFYAVNLGSKDAGVDRTPGNVEKDSALNGSVEWDRFSVDRGRAMAILGGLGEGGKDHQAIVIGNDSAGVSTGGGGVSCVTKGSLAALAHEMGHSLGGLHDEYEDEPGNNPKRTINKKRESGVAASPMPPNLMRGSEREEVLAGAPWKHWIDAGSKAWWNGSQVGAFEGGGLTHFNVWRAQASCMMRSSGSRFCVACMETLVKRIYGFVRPIDKVEPDEKQITLRDAEESLVKVWPMKPETHALEIAWQIAFLGPGDETEGSSSSTAVRNPVTAPFKKVYPLADADQRPIEAAHLRARDLKTGTYRLRVTVRDPTPWVILDPEKRLEQSREWLIRINPPRQPVPTASKSSGKTPPAEQQDR